MKRGFIIFSLMLVVDLIVISSCSQRICDSALAAVQRIFTARHSPGLDSNMHRFVAIQRSVGQSESIDTLPAKDYACIMPLKDTTLVCLKRSYNSGSGLLINNAYAFSLGLPLMRMVDRLSDIEVRTITPYNSTITSNTDISNQIRYGVIKDKIFHNTDAIKLINEKSSLISSINTELSIADSLQAEVSFSNISLPKIVVYPAIAPDTNRLIQLKVTLTLANGRKIETISPSCFIK